MKETEEYRLSNGQVVKSRSEYARLQKKIDFEHSIWLIANRDLSSNNDIYLVGNFIIENANELQKIFNKRYS